MNTSQALGMIETIGLVGLVEAADAAVKTANVTLTSYKNVEGGIVSLHIRGELGSVQAAVEAGSQAARRVGQLFAVHIIPAPVEDIDEAVFEQAAGE